MGAQASKQAVRRLPKEVRHDPAAIHEYPTETPSSLRESAAGMCVLRWGELHAMYGVAAHWFP